MINSRATGYKKNQNISSPTAGEARLQRHGMARRGPVAAAASARHSQLPNRRNLDATFKNEIRVRSLRGFYETRGEACEAEDCSLLEAFLKCRQVLSRFIGRVVAPGDIEDIVQETYVRSMQAGAARRIDHPKAFMFRTARNLALNHVQRLDNKVRPHMVDFLDEDAQPATQTLEAQFESQERFTYFCRAIDELPEKCRRAFILRKVYGLTQKEVAKFLEMTEANVEKHVSRGLMRCIEYMNGIEQGEGAKAREPAAKIRSGTVR